MVMIRASQEQLPPTEVHAIQSLRVLSAVEMAYFTQHGQYASPEELQAEGFLDPAWPRIDSQAYQISCDFGGERLGFECFADPASPESNFYYVNPSQVVRFEKDHRPDESSPVFGIPKENP